MEEESARKHIMTQLANKSDWILNVTEATHYGFADGVLGSSGLEDLHTIKKNNT